MKKIATVPQAQPQVVFALYLHDCALLLPLHTYLELVKLMVGTNSEIILKLSNITTTTHRRDNGPDVELISIGSIGSNNKMTGVRVWHRIPSYRHLEWFDVSKATSLNGDETLWIEVSDAARLIKIINSLISLAATSLSSHGFDSDEDNPANSNSSQFSVTFTETEMRLAHQPTGSSFTLPVRWFDSDWAAATITLPPTSIPQASVKLVSGLDQIAAILQKIDRWRDSFSIDTLSISLSPSNSNLWEIEFLAETSTPPHVRLAALLQHCPEYQSSTVPFTNQHASISVNLTAATKALLVPLSQSGPLSNAPSGVVLSVVPAEALICHVNWSAVGFGPISTTIFIPCRI